MTFDVQMVRVEPPKHLREKITSALGGFTHVLPASKTSKILLKPNLNANMNALTGNTTDLRLLAAVIEFLKTQGYRDIAIGEGTNSGYYRNRISVISRLRVDALADYYGVKVIDLNYSEPVPVEFEDGVHAGIAREVVEAGCLINMPKLKTHFEAGMSVCLKNLMGCLVGQESKKKTHQSLAKNILNINKVVKPQLHIVDGIISMEGLGPTRGVPIKTGTVFLGTDPYLLDLVCAKFASFDARAVRTLVEAEKRGIIDRHYFDFADNLRFDSHFTFKPPKAGPIASFIHSPKRQKYFLAVRNTPLFNYLCSTRVMGKLLFLTGLRQDVFIEEEMECTGLKVNIQKCSRCGKCAEYCPMGLDLPDAISEGNTRCISCLYCFCVCPETALEFEGKWGFMAEQLRQYDAIIRERA